MGKLLGELGIHGVKFTTAAGTLATFLMALLDAVQKLACQLQHHGMWGIQAARHCTEAIPWGWQIWSR